MKRRELSIPCSLIFLSCLFSTLSCQSFMTPGEKSVVPVAANDKAETRDYNAELSFLLAMESSLAGDYTSAAKLAYKAFEKNPDLYLGLFSLKQMRLANLPLKEYEFLTRQLYLRFSDKKEVAFLRAYTLFLLGEEEKSRAIFDESFVQEKNTQMSSYFFYMDYKEDNKPFAQFIVKRYGEGAGLKEKQNLAYWLSKLNMPSEAFSLLEGELVQLFEKKDFEQIFLAASLAYKAGQIEKTSELLKKLLAVNPKNAEALNFLGYLYAEEKTNLEEAQNLVLRALQIDNDNPYYLDSLGTIYFLSESLGQAEKYLLQSLQEFEKAKKKVPAEVYLHLAELYQARAQKKKAASYKNLGLSQCENNSTKVCKSLFLLDV